MSLDSVLVEEFVPLVIPVLGKEISTKELVQIVEKTRETGIKGEFYLSETGEFRFLSEKQKYDLVDFVSTIRQKDVQVIVGTTFDSVRTTVKFTQYAQAKRFDAFVLVPQYQTGMPPIEFVRCVLDHSDMPLVIYNNPWISNGRNFDTGDLAVLVDQYGERIKGVKDSSADLDCFKQLAWVRDNIATWLMVYQGSEEALIANPEFHMENADGIVSGTANFSPRLIKRVWRKIKGGHFDELAIDNKILEEYHESYKRAGSSVPVIKHHLYSAGLIMSPDVMPSNPIYKSKIITK